MSLRHIVLLPLTILLLLLPVAWFTAPLWLSEIAEYVLIRQQCSEVVVDFKEVGWNRSRIKRLHCKERDGMLEVDVTDAVVTYDITDLLEKRIEHMKLDAIALRLHPSAESKPEAMPLLATPTLILGALPVAGFDISNISLQRLNQDGEPLQELRGHASYSDQGISLELHESSYMQGLRATIEMDKKNRIRAAIYRGKSALLQAESTVHEADERISIDGIADIELAQLSALFEQWLNMPNQQLEGKLHAAWQVSLPVQTKQENKSLLQQLNARTTLELEFALTTPDLGANRGSVNLDMKYDQGLGTWAIGKRSLLKLGDRQKTTIGLSGLSGSFSLSESGWGVAIAENSNLQVKNLHIDDMLISPVHIKAETPVEIALDPDGSIKTMEKATITVALPTLRWQKNSLESRELKLTIHQGTLLSPTGSFIASGIRFTSPALQLPESNLSGTFDLKAEQVSATGKLSSQESGIHLNWKLSHDIVRQKGQMDFSFKPLLFGAAGIDLTRIVDSQGEYSIDNGTLSGNGQLQWRTGEKNRKSRLRSLLNFKLSNLKGHYKANLFSGLNGEMRITGDNSRLLMAPAEVTLESLHAGIPIHNISMHAAFTYPFRGSARMAINQLQAEALGGHISSERIAIDFARASNPFLVRLEHMDARQIAEIRRQEGLHVEGALDGKLPFDWTSKGLKMNSGELQSSSAGGLIRYIGTEYVRNLAATDTATKMVLDIMSDFHFKQLKIGVDYLPDGELAMRIKLKGNNPGYEKGRPIEFNLNIEENILKLLQSLSMTDKISGALEKEVQKILQQK
jgi:hypothetical protein